MIVRGRVVLVLWLVLLAWCGAIVLRTPISADMSAFLPRSPSAEQQILVDQLREGVVSRLLLIGIEGAPSESLAGLSNGLARALARSEQFEWVNNGSAELLDGDAKLLLQHRYLLSPTLNAERFSETGLKQALADGLDQLGSSASMLASQLLPRDPTGEMMRLIDQLQAAGAPEKRHGVWFGADDRRALLLAQTRAAGFDLDAQERAIADIHSLFSALPQSTVAQLRLSGPALFAVQARTSIKQDAKRFSLLATLLVALLLLIAYRSPRALILTFVPVASGALAGAACVGALYGAIHGTTLGFGATLIGEAVDYAIYFFSNAENGLPPQRTLDRIWPTLRLGVMTSVCGFCGMLFSGFPGLAQLGVFSICGLVVAALVTRWVLPALTPRDVRLRSSDEFPRILLRVFAALGALRGALPLILIGAFAWLLLRSGPFWSDDLASLSPVPQSQQRFDEEMRTALGAPNVRQLLVARGSGAQEVLQKAERTAQRLDALIQAGVLAGYDTPARFLPSEETQRTRLSALPQADELRRSLAAAVRGLPFRAGAFDLFLTDVETARTGAPLKREDLNGSSLALKVDSLLLHRRGEWFALLPLREVHDAAALARVVAADALLLDIKAASDALYQGYRGQVVLYSWVGAGAILLLLLLAMRSLRRVADTLFPLLAAVLATCAILVASGITLTLFHLVALLLVVGVGSNYSLFFERENFARANPRRTVAALVLCNLSTIIGFGLLGFAATPVLSSIGVTVALGALLSLLFAAVLTARIE